MKAVVTDGKGGIFFTNIPRPKIQNDYQCLCRIKASTTCTGTDVKLITGTLGFGRYPTLFGHESVGVVLECGRKVRNFKPGDLALRPCAVYPGTTLGELNSFAAGYTEYGLVTDLQALLEENPEAKYNGYARFQQKIPSSIAHLDPVDLSMLITLKETASTVSLATGCSIGKKVMVLGSGTVALSMARFARLFGADLVVLGARRTKALRYAEKIQCCNYTVDFRKNWTEQAKALASSGYDIIIDGTGSGEIMLQTGELLSDKGKLYPYATSHDKAKVVETLGEDKIGSGNPTEYAANDFLANAVDAGWICLKNYYSHVMPLSEIAAGFELIQSRKALKVVFEC